VAIALAAGFCLACWAFTFELVGRHAARVAVSLSLLFPGLGLILVSDGQLPGVLSLELLLLSLAALSRYARRGGAGVLLAAAAAMAASAAAHHATPLLAGPWLSLAVAGRWLMSRRPAIALRARRLVVALAACCAAVGLTMWPFLSWWLAQPAQAAIDHFSRHDFVADPGARFLGLWLPYSAWLGAWLCIALAAWRWRRLAPAAVAAAVLFVLSLGGTTPLARWLYGPRWEWLTYERYALWTAPLLVLFAAVHLRRLRHRPTPLLCLAALPPGLLLVLCLAYGAWYGRAALFEPARVDLMPAAQFLDGHHGGAYLTLGLGDQLARLSILTAAPTIDGDYNSARTNPLLTRSGVEKLDSIRYWDPEAQVLRAILSNPSAFGLRWVLVNDAYYDRFLSQEGWQPYATLADGVAVWTSPAAAASAVSNVPHTSLVAGIWWGAAPLFSFGLAVIALCRVYLCPGRGWWQAGRVNSPFPARGALRSLGNRETGRGLVSSRHNRPRRSAWGN
jgi:hypothetical protein